ncbi:MAG TPA: hypothetical protein PK530_12215 [Anaerolineales bacterium]|nr:hypothetical protein [Anaerolineales bacterium]
MYKKLFLAFVTLWIAWAPVKFALAYTNESQLMKRFSKTFADNGTSEYDSQTTLSVQTPVEYIREDKDWTIVDSERYTYIDAETGLFHEHVTI